MKSWKQKNDNLYANGQTRENIIQFQDEIEEEQNVSKFLQTTQHESQL